MEETRAVVRYKVYEIQNGLLLEPQEDWGGNKYSDYMIEEEAIEAIRKDNGQGLVIIPQVYTHANY